jgi:hypothetical protein
MMKKILFILGMLVYWTSVSYSQEIVGLNNGFDYNLNCKNLEKHNIVRTDENGNVIWTLSFSNTSQPFDSSQENYIVFGNTNIKNGKIISNPSDYDYWLVEKEEEINFSIFPNPSIGFINIYTSFIDDKSEIEITDEMNRIVYRSKINEIITNLDLTRYSKGMYFVKIFNNEKILKFEKICIN